MMLDTLAWIVQIYILWRIFVTGYMHKRDAYSETANWIAAVFLTSIALLSILRIAGLIGD